MKYVMTFFWSFCLVTMLNYVSGAIANVPVFDFMTGTIVSAIFAVIVIVLAESFPEGEIADH
ncbi:YjzD family protein [Sporosarcina sp. E16_8]|uniref:YjzD family protein n=1 Tax=Sporosarcina sp. E16_8 TaxID=2789295 RepID=UPI001A914636|nr:YjzD family protein [Sporosarcina sp. E16_8]MBO0586014.1 YjzD family protein [Sporosarcina sp. E16_8]